MPGYTHVYIDRVGVSGSSPLQVIYEKSEEMIISSDFFVILG